MRLSFDFWEISLFQQGVNNSTHGKPVPEKKKIKNRRTYFLPQPPFSFLPKNEQCHQAGDIYLLSQCVDAEKEETPLSLEILV